MLKYRIEPYHNIIITYFDDDWIYPPMLIEKLYETYRKLFNYEKIKEICPIKDEIWLNAILKKNNIKIVNVDNKFQKKGEKKPLGTKWGLKKGRYHLVERTQEKALAKTLKFSINDYIIRLEN